MKLWHGCLLASVCVSGTGRAQKEEGPFDRKNAFTLLAEYANDSSHIVAGAARQRKLVTVGGAYARRVVRFGGTEIGYRVEVRPLVFESDPVYVTEYTYADQLGVSQFSSTTATAGVCRPTTSTTVEPAPPPTGKITITQQTFCGRQWTFGQTFTPIGFQYTTAIRHRVQPYIVGTLGYMYTSRPIPVANAEAFNFVVDLGAGVQVYRTRRRSVALEARLRHISNRNTAAANPGIDTVTYGACYSFGR